MAHHQIESELMGPIPRRVTDPQHVGCLFGAGRLFILPHTIAGIVLLGRAITGTFLWLAVLVAGTQVDGVVVDKSATTSKKGSTTYVLSYSFECGGKVINEKVSVGHGVYEFAQKGQVIPISLVTWAPEWGHWPHVEGYVPIWETAKLWLFALFWNVILSFFIWHLYFVPLVQRRLLKRGVPVAGVVTEVERKSGRGGMQATVTFDYVAQWRDGTSRTVHDSTTVEAKKVTGWKPGDVVTVLYDARRPTWNVVYRLASYRVEAGDVWQ